MGTFKQELKMRSLFLLFFIFAITANAAMPGPNERRGQPFNRYIDKRFRNLEGERRVLKLPYTFSSTNAASGASASLGASIPAGSYILKTYVIVNEDVTSSNSNTVAFGCASTADLAAANNYADDTVNTIVNGAITAENATLYTSTGCTPTINIGVGASGVTAGELVLVTEFIDADNVLGLGDIDFTP